jgi:hypothetical protein
MLGLFFLLSSGFAAFLPSIAFFRHSRKKAIDGRKAAEFFYLESNLVRIGFGKKLRQR